MNVSTRRRHEEKTGRGPGAAGFVLAAALVLGGCSSTLSELPVVGLPEGTPARAAEPPAYPAIYDAPNQPAGQPLNAAEQTRLEAELAGARDRQAKSAGAAPAPAAAKPGRDPKAGPKPRKGEPQAAPSD